MSRFWFWSLCFLGTSVVAAPVQKVLPLSTTINKSLLYPYTLSLNLEPDRLALQFDTTEKRFISKDIVVQVVTDIPNAESGFTYQLSVIKNESQCYRDYAADVVEQNFITLLFDSAPFVNGDIVEALELEAQSSGTLGAEHTLTLNSDVIDAEALMCSGSIMLEAELSL